jgi:hypothetical protein
MKNFYVGSSAIIVANGPSSSNLDWVEIERARKTDSCFLFLVNYSVNDPQIHSRGCDFLVLSDPGSHPSSKEARTVLLWKNIRAMPGLKLITPISWHLKFDDEFCKTADCFHFSDLSLETFTRSTNPLKPRGYPALTAYKALAFANFLGFNPIFIAGFDNSMFRTLKVNSENSLIQNPNHFTLNYGSPEDVTQIYPRGVADYFSEVSEMFLSLKRAFSNAFPKIQKGKIGSNFLKKNEQGEDL